MTRPLTALSIGIGLLAGCAPEPPPARTVSEFLENPILLEAAMVRCAADRTGTRYDQECINAREAVRNIQTKEEEARRVDLEARSASKLQALRRSRQADAEARRRAEDAERLRREAEYQAQFGVLPPQGDDAAEALPEGNLPTAVVPEAESQDPLSETYGDVVPPSDGGNAPVAEPVPEEDKP